MSQILTNARVCAEGKRPLCQDTGIVNVFLKVGMDVRFDTRRTLQELCDEGVRRGYTNPDNPLRASVLDDPIFARKNRSEEHTSELQSLMRISYAVFCLKKNKTRQL